MKIPAIRAAAVALTAAAALVALSACTAPTSSSSSGSGGGTATVGYVELLADTFFNGIETGLHKGLGKNTDIVTVNYDSDATKETQAYDNLISRGVDVIVTSPLDPDASVAGIRNAAQAGIPVVCVNTCINDKDAKKYVTAFVVSDNEQLGKLTGERAAAFIKGRLGGTAHIGILNCDVVALCKVRKKAFTDALDAAGVTYDIAADQEGYQPDAAVPVATAELTAHPEINLMWASNDGGTIGSVKAIQSVGRAGKTFLFGTDVSEPLVTSLLASDDVLQSVTGQDGVANGEKVAEIVKALQKDPKYKPKTFQQLVDVVNFDRGEPAAAKDWLADNG